MKIDTEPSRTHLQSHVAEKRSAVSPPVEPHRKRQSSRKRTGALNYSNQTQRERQEYLSVHLATLSTQKLNRELKRNGAPSICRLVLVQNILTLIQIEWAREAQKTANDLDKDIEESFFSSHSTGFEITSEFNSSHKEDVEMEEYNDLKGTREVEMMDVDRQHIQVKKKVAPHLISPPLSPLPVSDNPIILPARKDSLAVPPVVSSSKKIAPDNSFEMKNENVSLVRNVKASRRESEEHVEFNSQRLQRKASVNQEVIAQDGTIVQRKTNANQEVISRDSPILQRKASANQVSASPLENPPGKGNHSSEKQDRDVHIQKKSAVENRDTIPDATTSLDIAQRKEVYSMTEVAPKRSILMNSVKNITKTVSDYRNREPIKPVVAVKSYNSTGTETLEKELPLIPPKVNQMDVDIYLPKIELVDDLLSGFEAAFDLNWGLKLNS